MASARKPIASDSPSATTPRTTGSRKNQCRAIAEWIGWLTPAMPPPGGRTATAQLDGPRIITPSRTAWPPIAALPRSLRLLRLPGPRGPALEALDAAAGVHQLLLARVERVAVGADLDVQLGLGGARLERVPARARDRRELVLGVNVSLHLHVGYQRPFSSPRCLRRRRPPPSRRVVPGSCRRATR